MPKIILSTDAWKPQVNGVVVCVEKIQENLQKRGFEVLVINPTMFFSLPVPFYPEIRFAFFPKKKIKKIIQEFNPDYIHIFTEGTIGLATRSICLENDLRFTTSQHTNYQNYVDHYLKIKIKFLNNAIYSYLRWFHNKSASCMAITKRLKNQFEENGFLNISLWPLGVDTDFFVRNKNSTIKEKYNLKAPIFAYMGRVAYEKNVEEFLKLDLPGTKLVIGDGPVRKNLERRYGKNNLFFGYRFGQELIDFLSICDVYVFPSLTDTFPLSIIEAIACGLPVACHDVMGLSDLITKDVGVLDQDLKKAALDCLKIDKEKCRQYALNFSWEKSADHFINNLVKTKN